MGYSIKDLEKAGHNINEAIFSGFLQSDFEQKNTQPKENRQNEKNTTSAVRPAVFRCAF